MKKELKRLTTAKKTISNGKKVSFSTLNSTQLTVKLNQFYTHIVNGIRLSECNSSQAFPTCGQIYTERKFVLDLQPKRKSIYN